MVLSKSPIKSKKRTITLEEARQAFNEFYEKKYPNNPVKQQRYKILSMKNQKPSSHVLEPGKPGSARFLSPNGPLRFRMKGVNHFEKGQQLTLYNKETKKDEPLFYKKNKKKPIKGTGFFTVKKCNKKPYVKPESGSDCFRKLYNQRFTPDNPLVKHRIFTKKKKKKLKSTPNPKKKKTSPLPKKKKTSPLPKKKKTSPLPSYPKIFLDMINTFHTSGNYKEFYLEYDVVRQLKTIDLDNYETDNIDNLIDKLTHDLKNKLKNESKQYHTKGQFKGKITNHDHSTVWNNMDEVLGDNKIYKNDVDLYIVDIDKYLMQQMS